MPFNIPKRLQDWWQCMRHVVAKHSYVALVVTLVLVGMLVEAIRAGWGWEVVVVLIVFLAAIATNLLASVIDRWVHHRVSPGEAHMRYLQSLIKQCQLLPLAALGGEEGIDRGPTLDQLYIDLNTTTQPPRDTAGRQHHRDDPRVLAERGTEAEPLTAKDAFAQTPRLVLLGTPGSGKSTFVRQVLVEQARVILGGASALPGLSRDLLPVLMTLRELVPRLARLDVEALSHEDRRQRLARAVRDQAVEDLHRWETEPFADGLYEALTTGRCLLVLDGLDEVPSDLRQRVREAVMAVLDVYRPQRVIVTCRVRSYVGEAVLPDFQAHTLADFSDEKIQAFVHAWYNAQRDLGRVDASQAEHKAADLTQAALTDELRELATNPMLLTTMAIIHQRETQLPRERVCLYNQAVDVLARRWQQSKVGEAGLTAEPRLAAILTDNRRLRSIVEGLAYKIHDEQQHRRAANGLPRGDALVFLEQPIYLGHVELANAFLNYIDERAGLLMGQGGALGQPATYGFPHRTFQEYLTGCYLMSQPDREGRIADCARQGEFWSLAIRFGAEELLYNNRRGDYELLRLADYLCPQDVPSTLHVQRAALWSGIMAALVGREAIERDPRAGAGITYLERIQRGLMHILCSDLSAPERADAGNALATLGDPRFYAEDLLGLTKDDMLGLVKIPAGPFRMGSAADDDSALDDEREEHDVDLPTYYIARYPVTVAQFRAFVDANPEYRWKGESGSQGSWNHPVVWVSWHDAIAYCEWLTARLRERWDDLPERLQKALHGMQWQITLPSEAEWEKAARGIDGRRYPWGNNPDPNRANYDETGIDTTSAVGCFPGGASPYGVEDMSGNVWEWTRSLWGKDWQKSTFRYPYHPDDGREAPEASDDILRVLRGGSFWGHHRGVRCAYRNGDAPRYVGAIVGFRVVVAERP